MKERRKRRSAKDIKESIINAVTYIFRSIPVHFPAAYKA